MDLFYSRYDDRYQLEVLSNNTLTDTHDLKVKFTDINFMSKCCLKIFVSTYFPDHMMVGMMIDIGSRFNSAISRALVNNIKNKAMDLELLR